MSRIIFSLLFVLTFLGTVHSQELIRNGDFEIVEQLDPALGKEGIIGLEGSINDVFLYTPAWEAIGGPSFYTRAILKLFPEVEDYHDMEINDSAFAAIRYNHRGKGQEIFLAKLNFPLKADCKLQLELDLLVANETHRELGVQLLSKADKGVLERLGLGSTSLEIVNPMAGKTREWTHHTLSLDSDPDQGWLAIAIQSKGHSRAESLILLDNISLTTDKGCVIVEADF